MQPHVSEVFAALLGLDWAEAQHEVCLQAAGPAQRELLSLAQRPAARNAWGQTLRTRCHGPPVAVGLELTKGPSVSALRHEARRGLLPVHPRPVATSRAALTPSRAHDDPTDAARQVDILLTHRDTLIPRSLQSPPMRAVAPDVASRRRLVGDHVRLPRRVTRALTNSCPQVLPWCPKKAPAILGDFRRRWPTLNAAPRARRAPAARQGGPQRPHLRRGEHDDSAAVGASGPEGASRHHYGRRWTRRGLCLASGWIIWAVIRSFIRDRAV